MAWQMQSGKRQYKVEIVSVLRRSDRRRILHCMRGRTDAGCIARPGEVFRTQSGLSAQEFQRALNAILPPTIPLWLPEEVGPDFSARWSATPQKTRAKFIAIAVSWQVVPPMLWLCVAYPFPLDEEKNRGCSGAVCWEAMTLLRLRVDGSRRDDKERSTVREIYSTEFVVLGHNRTGVHRSRRSFLCATWFARWSAHCWT